MTVGTKSVLYGAHCFFLHPFFVAWAWTKLYGFPFDPRLWAAFFLHDIGYIGCSNMDGEEGERHPEIGARIMGWLFDLDYQFFGLRADRSVRTWHDFTLFHSRYYAKREGHSPSRLCFADKLAFCLTPRWLYLPMVTATGEIDEYLHNAQKSDSAHWTPTNYDKERWHSQLHAYMYKWVYEHLDGAEDTWTKVRKHQ